MNSRITDLERNQELLTTRNAELAAEIEENKQTDKPRRAAANG
jgi:hypothetical protein